MVQFGMEMTFGDWLKVRRRQLDLTQKALAYEAGCGLGTLRKLENGSRRPSKELAARIGQALQVPEEEMPVFVEFARSDPDPIQLPSFAQKQITPPQVQIPEPEPPNVSPPPHNLPFTLTRIIGRDGEIAELSHFLLHSHQRLITLVGVGGIGKTRLATAVAHAILLRPGQPFHDGIFFIPLAAIVYKEDIVTAVAQALDFQFTSGSRTPKQQLLDYLRDKRMLLFMDNFEQIQEGFSILLDILHIAGNVKVLVTSRETLGILGEQQYPLKGLSYPQRANALAELNEYAAPTLFLERAANLLPDFNITATEIADLLKICHLVDGMPLALELAVVWCDTLPLAEIAASIERNLGFLKSNWRDLPSRHQSIRAVFEASWLRMPSAEQIGFACLSVFRGGFTREAAESVAGLGPYQLKSLLTRAFIYLDRDHQRYQIHELLRQYAADILAKEVEDEFQAQNKHADFFTDFLWQRHEQWHSDKQKEILSGLLVERENIVQTWRWHCHNANIKAISSTLDSFANFLEWQGNIVE
jgi:predicted ATPase/transcriptional regulator with XRE-family HTH domain